MERWGGGGGCCNSAAWRFWGGGGLRESIAALFSAVAGCGGAGDGGGSPGAGMGVGPLPPPPPAPHPVDFLTLYRKATLHASQGVAESSSSLFLQPSSWRIWRGGGGGVLCIWKLFQGVVDDWSHLVLDLYPSLVQTSGQCRLLDVSSPYPAGRLTVSIYLYTYIHTYIYNLIEHLNWNELGHSVKAVPVWLPL